MTLCNADGGVAEMSGNGMRCLAWVAARAGLGDGERARRRHRRRAPHRRRSTVDARRRRRRAPTSTWARSRSTRRRSRSTPTSPFDLEATFHGATYRGRRRRHRQPAPRAASSTIPTPARVTAARSARSSTTRASRTRTNVEFVARAPGPTRSRCGCGSAASARRCRAAPARARRPRSRTGAGSSASASRVHVPGGELAVELGDTVRLGGPVVHVFDVDVDLDAPSERCGLAMSRPRRPGRRPPPAHRDRGRPRASSSSARCSSAPASGRATPEEAEASLDELALLADTAGAEPVESVLQRRDTPDPATYIGKGKAEELRELADALDVDVVIFDDELTPAQQRNLEKLFARRRRRPRRADPRHLRPARDEPGGHGAGRARAAPLPVAAPARPRHSS